jgi:hypothetical protein
MSADTPIKSAYELAMERLQKKDAEQGVEQTPLTDEQKAAIAEIRRVYQAKLAELEILHQGKLRSTVDPAERETLDAEYRRDCERLSAERDRKIENAR